MRRAFDSQEYITIFLSRRNLRSLLAKLNEPDSQRTLVCHADKFIVIAEEDDAHYNHVTRGKYNYPGEVSDTTDAALETIEFTEGVAKKESN